LIFYLICFSLLQVSQLARDYDWVESDKQYFGQKNGMYDFAEHNMQEVGGRLSKLKDLKDKLARSVNTRAMNLLGKEEEQVSKTSFTDRSCGNVRNQS